MLVRCPQCGTEFRLVDFKPDERVVKYLCPGCNDIVRIDLEQDEVQHSSSSGHYSTIERRKTVLVADDAPKIREQARKLLEEAGYNVLLARDGADALRMVREEHPDLVVLDLLMPGMTGFDVLRAVLDDERLKSTSVLTMSGVYKDNVVEFLQQLGVQGFLDKEQLAQTLVFRVNQALDSKTES
jgi:chemosensory pili system protein ChpA (sensor histidine kinase/response regulator)